MLRLWVGKRESPQLIRVRDPLVLARDYVFGTSESDNSYSPVILLVANAAEPHHLVEAGDVACNRFSLDG